VNDEISMVLMRNQASLDPRINSWKRGDFCTRGFQEAGFVVSYTVEYLEVRWNGKRGTEKVPSDQAVIFFEVQSQLNGRDCFGSFLEGIFSKQ
jgi:hypothetical protein